MLRKPSAATWERQQEPAECPGHLSDPLARAIDWGPLEQRGSTASGSGLQQISPRRIELRRPPLQPILGGVALLLGLPLIGLALYLFITTPQSLGILLFLGGPGVLLSLGGIKVLRSALRPPVFDKDRGYYWVGSVCGIEAAAAAQPPQAVRLDNIQALQIVAEACSHIVGRHQRQEFMSYELNLVLSDKTRLNLLDHAHLEQLRRDAKLLGDFLGVPVWDAAGIGQGI